MFDDRLPLGYERRVNLLARVDPWMENCLRSDGNLLHRIGSSGRSQRAMRMNFAEYCERLLLASKLLPRDMRFAPGWCQSLA